MTALEAAVALASCVEECVGTCNEAEFRGETDTIRPACLARARRCLEASHHAQLVEALRSAGATLTWGSGPMDLYDLGRFRNAAKAEITLIAAALAAVGENP